jgi:hypothetical protein
MPRVLAEGVIEFDSAKKLANFLAIKTRQDFLPDSPDICFNSPGGNVIGGMELGRYIRKRGLSTCLAREYSKVNNAAPSGEELIASNVICASSCTIAFLGERNRYIEDNVRYGAHQFSGAKGNVGDSVTQATVAILGTYIESMGVSRKLLDRASLVPPEKIAWLSPTELTEFGIDNMKASPAEWKLETLDDGTVFAQAFSNGVGNQPSTAISLGKPRGLPLLWIAMQPNPVIQTTADQVLEALNDASVSVYLNRQRIAFIENSKWNVSPKGIALTTVSLPSNIRNLLRGGQKLSVDVDLPRAYTVFNPSMSVPITSRTQPVFAAALK